MLYDLVDILINIQPNEGVLLIVLLAMITFVSLAGSLLYYNRDLTESTDQVKETKNDNDITEGNKEKMKDSPVDNNMSKTETEKASQDNESSSCAAAETNTNNSDDIRSEFSFLDAENTDDNEHIVTPSSSLLDLTNDFEYEFMFNEESRTFNHLTAVVEDNELEIHEQNSKQPRNRLIFKQTNDNVNEKVSMNPEIDSNEHDISASIENINRPIVDEDVVATLEIQQELESAVDITDDIRVEEFANVSDGGDSSTMLRSNESKKNTTVNKVANANCKNDIYHIPAQTNDKKPYDKKYPSKELKDIRIIEKNQIKEDTNNLTDSSIVNKIAQLPQETETLCNELKNEEEKNRVGFQTEEKDKEFVHGNWKRNVFHNENVIVGSNEKFEESANKESKNITNVEQESLESVSTENFDNMKMIVKDALNVVNQSGLQCQTNHGQGKREIIETDPKDKLTSLCSIQQTEAECNASVACEFDQREYVNNVDKVNDIDANNEIFVTEVMSCQVTTDNKAICSSTLRKGQLRSEDESKELRKATTLNRDYTNDNKKCVDKLEAIDRESLTDELHDSALIDSDFNNCIQHDLTKPVILSKTDAQKNSFEPSDVHSNGTEFYLDEKDFTVSRRIPNTLRQHKDVNDTEKVSIDANEFNENDNVKENIPPQDVKNSVNRGTGLTDACQIDFSNKYLVNRGIVANRTSKACKEHHRKYRNELTDSTQLTQDILPNSNKSNQHFLTDSYKVNLKSSESKKQESAAVATANKEPVSHSNEEASITNSKQIFSNNMGQLLSQIFETDRFEDLPLETIDMLGGKIIISEDGEYAVIDIEGKRKEYKIDKQKVRYSQDFSEKIRNSRDLSALFKELESLDVVEPASKSDKRRSLLERLSVDDKSSAGGNMFDLHKIAEDLQKDASAQKKLVTVKVEEVSTDSNINLRVRKGRTWKEKAVVSNETEVVSNSAYDKLDAIQGDEFNTPSSSQSEASHLPTDLSEQTLVESKHTMDNMQTLNNIASVHVERSKPDVSNFIRDKKDVYEINDNINANLNDIDNTSHFNYSVNLNNRNLDQPLAVDGRHNTIGEQLHNERKEHEHSIITDFECDLSSLQNTLVDNTKRVHRVDKSIADADTDGESLNKINVQIAKNDKDLDDRGILNDLEKGSVSRDLPKVLACNEVSHSFPEDSKDQSCVTENIEEETLEEVLQEKSTSELLSDLKDLLAIEETEISKSLSNLLEIDKLRLQVDFDSDFDNAVSLKNVTDKLNKNSTDPISVLNSTSPKLKIKPDDLRQSFSPYFAADSTNFFPTHNIVDGRKRSNSWSHLSLAFAQHSLEDEYLRRERSQSMELQDAKASLIISENMKSSSSKIKETNLDDLITSLRNGSHDKLAAGNYPYSHRISCSIEPNTATDTFVDNVNETEELSETEIDIPSETKLEADTNGTAEKNTDELKLTNHRKESLDSEKNVDDITLSDEDEAVVNDGLVTDIDEALKRNENVLPTSEKLDSVLDLHDSNQDSDCNISIVASTDSAETKKDDTGKEEIDYTNAKIEQFIDEKSSIGNANDSVSFHLELVGPNECLEEKTKELVESTELQSPVFDSIAQNVLDAYTLHSNAEEISKTTPNTKESEVSSMEKLGKELADYETITTLDDLECLAFMENLSLCKQPDTLSILESKKFDNNETQDLNNLEKVTNIEIESELIKPSVSVQDENMPLVCDFNANQTVTNLNQLDTEKVADVVSEKHSVEVRKNSDSEVINLTAKGIIGDKPVILPKEANMDPGTTINFNLADTHDNFTNEKPKDSESDSSFSANSKEENLKEETVTTSLDSNLDTPSSDFLSRENDETGAKAIENNQITEEITDEITEEIIDEITYVITDEITNEITDKFTDRTSDQIAETVTKSLEECTAILSENVILSENEDVTAECIEADLPENVTEEEEIKTSEVATFEASVDLANVLEESFENLNKNKTFKDKTTPIELKGINLDQPNSVKTVAENVIKNSTAAEEDRTPEIEILNQEVKLPASKLVSSETAILSETTTDVVNNDKKGKEPEEEIIIGELIQEQEECPSELIQMDPSEINTLMDKVAENPLEVPHFKDLYNTDISITEEKVTLSSQVPVLAEDVNELQTTDHPQFIGDCEISVDVDAHSNNTVTIDSTYSSISTVSSDASNELSSNAPNTFEVSANNTASLECVSAIMNVSSMEPVTSVETDSIPQITVGGSVDESDIDFEQPLSIADQTISGELKVASIATQQSANENIVLTSGKALEEVIDVGDCLLTSTPRQNIPSFPQEKMKLSEEDIVSIKITLDEAETTEDSSYGFINPDADVNSDLIKTATIALQVTPRHEAIKSAPCTPVIKKRQRKNEHEPLKKSNSFKGDYRLSRESQLLMDSLEGEMDDEDSLMLESSDDEILNEIVNTKNNLRRVTNQKLIDSTDNLSNPSENVPANVFTPEATNISYKKRFPSESTLLGTNGRPTSLILKSFDESKRVKSLHNIFTKDDLETDIDEVDEKELQDVLRSPNLSETFPDVLVTDVDKMLSTSLPSLNTKLTRKYSKRLVIVSRKEKRKSLSVSDDIMRSGKSEREGKQRENTDNLLKKVNETLQNKPKVAVDNGSDCESIKDKTLHDLNITNNNQKNSEPPKIQEDEIHSIAQDVAHESPEMKFDIDVNVPKENYGKHTLTHTDSNETVKNFINDSVPRNEMNHSKAMPSSPYRVSAELSKHKRDSWDVLSQQHQTEKGRKSTVEQGAIKEQQFGKTKVKQKHHSWNILDLKTEEQNEIDVFLITDASKEYGNRDSSDITYLFEKYQREREAIRRMNEKRAGSISDFSEISSLSDVSSSNSRTDLHQDEFEDSKHFSQENLLAYEPVFSPITSDDEIGRLNMFQLPTNRPSSRPLSNSSPKLSTSILSPVEITEMPSPKKPVYVPEMDQFNDEDLGTLVLAQAASAVRKRRRGGRSRSAPEDAKKPDTKTTDSGISDSSNNLSPLGLRSASTPSESNLKVQPGELRKSQELWSLNSAGEDTNVYKALLEIGSLSQQNVLKHTLNENRKNSHSSVHSRNSSTSTLQHKEFETNGGHIKSCGSEPLIHSRSVRRSYETVASLPDLQFKRKLSNDDFDLTDEFLSESSMLSDSCFEPSIQNEQYIYPSLHLRNSRRNSIKIHAESDSSDDESFTMEVEELYNNVQVNDTERTVVCGNPPCSKQQVLVGNARSMFTSCPSCFTCYCSRSCRRQHWQEHKRICFYGRIGYYMRSFLRRCEKDVSFNSYLKEFASDSAQKYGKGCIIINFESATEAKIELMSTSNALSKKLVYASVETVQQELPRNRHSHLLIQNLQDYDLEQECVVNLSIAISNKKSSSNKRKSTIVRCARISILDPKNSMYGDVLSAYAIRTFTLPKMIGTDIVMDMETRRYYCREISFGLRRCGVRLKKEYLEAYQKLCRYVEQEVIFLPLVLYGQRDGRNYKCILYSGKVNKSEEAHGGGVLV